MKFHSFLSIFLLLLFSCSTSSKIQPTQIDPLTIPAHIPSEEYFKIPLQYLESGHLLVKAKVNYITGDFILDTGAGRTLIDINSPGKFNMEMSGYSEKASGAGGGNLPIQFSSQNTFNIGPLSFKEMTIGILDLQHINDAFTTQGLNRIDGIIGSDIFTACDAIIDYHQLILYLKQPH